jgi:hypothetical protein
MPKEKPILFSGDMVKAILDGRKTQTRRIVKPQPYLRAGLWQWDPTRSDHDIWLENEAFDSGDFGPWRLAMCPYGVPGDRLWVRETFTTDFIGPRNRIVYRTDNEVGICKWKPSIFMPRAASRITLEITEVRCQRLHEISDDDAISEGVTATTKEWLGVGHAVAVYSDLWDSINGKGAWDKKPWIWAISFKRINPPANLSTALSTTEN